ncbi:MAG TPA: hypothetical protein VIG70_02595 [Burkholderiales bacterium]|jgi:membrane-bound lytic murein transglycosylase B
MSAAATAAGYLYASGRLRGRTAREQEEGPKEIRKKPQKPAPRSRERIRVAVYQPEPRVQEQKKVPKIEYRTRRRWSAE